MEKKVKAKRVRSQDSLSRKRLRREMEMKSQMQDEQCRTKTQERRSSATEPKCSGRKAILHQWAKRERLAEAKDHSVKRKRPLGEYPYDYRKYRMHTVTSRLMHPFSGKELKGKDRRTLPLMSKFDIHFILENRLKQLWDCHPVHPDCPPHITRLPEVTEWELFNRKLEGELVRRHPNGDYERWMLSELKFPKLHAH